MGSQQHPAGTALKTFRIEWRSVNGVKQEAAVIRAATFEEARATFFRQEGRGTYFESASEVKP